MLTLAFFAIFIFYPARATDSIEVIEFYSNHQSADATLMFNEYLQEAKIVFELVYDGKLIETKHFTLKNISSSQKITKIVTWKSKPEFGYYVGNLKIYINETLVEKKSISFSYGTASMADFQVLYFNSDSKGAVLFLKQINPRALSIKFELIDSGDIIYTELKKDIMLMTSADPRIPSAKDVIIDWPILLTRNKEYIVRAKVYSHFLYSPSTAYVFLSNFTADDDIEISRDVDVGEFGASVTLIGKSQVPFGGHIKITLNETNDPDSTRIFTKEVDRVTSGKKETIGISWSLPAGMYNVEVLALNKENIIKDRYETTLRVLERPVMNNTEVEKKSPALSGFDSISIVLVVFIFYIMKKSRNA